MVLVCSQNPESD